jgi:hypothetical protein
MHLNAKYQSKMYVRHVGSNDHRAHGSDVQHVIYKRRLEGKEIKSNDWIIRFQEVLDGPEEQGFNKLYLMAMFTK